MRLARIHEESTVLALGSRGSHGGRAFTLVGRTCVRSDGGGLWNEWTIRFDDGSERWLAEAGGTFTLYDEAAIAPAFDALVPGGPLDTGFIVVERGQATRAATWGDVADMPKKYRYADLSSARGTSATLDYGERAPRVFTGERVTLKALGLSPRPEPPRFLSAPDVSRPKGVELWFAIGDEGALLGGKFRVIGVLARSLRAEGERYTWEEYLLHHAEHGFRWLVVSDGHWNLVTRVEPGLVRETDRGAVYEGETYAPLSTGKARVDWADGQLPWEVAIGDTANVADYVRGERVLSKEWTEDEIAWSIGTYFPVDALARAFGKRALPKQVGRAPNQPKRARRR